MATHRVLARWRLLLGGGVRTTSEAVAIQLASFAIALAALILFLGAIGYDIGVIFRSLWEGSVGSAFAVGISANEAIPLILTGTAVWVAFQGGLFNIGADGQLQIGALTALVVVSIAALPQASWVLIPLGLAAATLAGAGWAAIAGVLKVFRGVNEIISTLMLNYIAFIVVTQLMRGPLQSPANTFTPQTDPIPVAAEIKPFVAGTQLNWGIIVAALLSLTTVVLVKRTTIGLRLRAIGLSLQAARHAGVPVRLYWSGSLVMSGALCGLAGGLILLGLRYYIAPGWASPWGLFGIVIAFLALSNPYLIPLWGLLFGMLASAGPTLKGNASVPDSVVTLMQTLPVVALFLLYAIARWMRARPSAEPSLHPEPATQAGR